MLGNREDAVDLVQGLFLDLLEDGQTSFDLPYLYRAITNRCLNHLRDRGNRQRLLRAQHDVLAGPVRTLCDERVISADLLVRLFGRLNAGVLEVLAYHYLDDMSQDEIAELMQISRKTVGKRLQKVRAAVAALVAERKGEAA
jgi:RNA polymerase sigma-70 factor (ECF subfamily)